VFSVGKDGEKEIVRGSIDRIGTRVRDHTSAVSAALTDLEQRNEAKFEAVGHRVVHGGQRHAEPARVDERLLAELEALASFAPLHLPAEISAIRAVSQHWPACPQVACFDTAFHRTLSEVAQRYALPEDLHVLGLRRFGFHGLSYEYVVATLGAQALGRAVIAHLGSGASMAAVQEGRSIDTTMGFTPAGGLVMGTRTGDIDPGLLVYLAARGHGPSFLDDLVSRRGGLLGVSGTTADVRELLAVRDRDARARLAIDVFVWSARKWIGAMAAALGGLDSLIFTGGIGEHAAPIRAEIVSGLGHLGARVDHQRNGAALGCDAIISPEGATCSVRVVRTDEERMVARHTASFTHRARGE
jgi:acetate kinase